MLANKIQKSFEILSHFKKPGIQKHFLFFKKSSNTDQ